MKECKIIAEIGINHNGDIDTALKMMDVAKDAGCDYVKFQKREPDLCVPREQRDVMRDTPWGKMPYIEYKKRIEFGEAEYNIIDEHAKLIGIKWFMSVWDFPSLDFAARYNPEIIKIPSALNENIDLICAARKVAPTLIISTGMLSMQGLAMILNCVDHQKCIMMHTVSAYPLDDIDANLSAMHAIQDYAWYISVGYSDHTKGIHMAVAAVAMGATMIEKHITLDRTMWGTDQSASIEPDGLKKMVRNIRAVCSGWGDGSIAVRECEAEAKRRLKGE